MFCRSFKADLRSLSRQKPVPIRQSLPGRIPHIRPASSTPARGPNLLLNGSLAAGLLAAAGAAYYYETSGSATTTDANPAGGETFEIALGSGRRRETHTFTRLSNSACETKLHEHEISHTVGRPGNPVVKWDRNWLGSNEPCEDRSAVDLIPRSRSAREMANTGWGSWLFGSSAGASPILVGERGEGKNDLVLFSIIDGHGGWATSELLSKVLHPTLTLSLAALQAGIVPGDEGWMGKIRKLNPLSWSSGPVWTQENVMRAISSAYDQLDDNIVQTPVKLISTLSTRPSPGQPSPRQTLAALAVPADNGACSISAVVDAEAGDLYVALAGDCRAVAGWEKDGVWRCDVLSEDQMGENNREVDRMRKEHPGEEDTVIMRGRVHGGLQPTRAFGDASYKWTQGQAAVICDALQAEGKKARRPRPHNKTPPYVTARPEITHRKIQGQDGEKLRFVVLATDGLWDRITSEESTLLLASYLSHRTHPEIHKSTLPQQFPLRSSIYSASATAPPFSTPCYASAPSDLPAQNPSTATKASDHPYPAEDLPGSASRSHGTWVFEGDENAATHLIRNSLGGGDRKGRNELLSLTGGVTRWLRDDITVTVVFFDDSPKQT